MVCLQVHASQNINVLLYHGKAKDSVASARSLAAYSVVITSYTVVANECTTVVTKVAKGTSDAPIDLASDDEDERAPPTADRCRASVLCCTLCRVLESGCHLTAPAGGVCNATPVADCR